MHQDPGWDVSPRSLLGGLGPIRSLRRNEPGGVMELVLLRQVFVSFSGALVGITVVLALLADGVDDGSAELSIALIVIIGCASLVAGRLVRRQLDGSSDEALVASYRTRFFIRLAVAEAATLAGFAIAIVIGPWWVYLIGLVFTIAGFVRLAPTARNLARDDNDLRANGCHRSLSRLLSSTVATPTR